MDQEEQTQGERMYSIKEASELTDVPPHTLRLWERKIPEVVRAERTTGGQRRYTGECLERIRNLAYYVRHKRMTLVGAKRMLDEGFGQASEAEHRLRNDILADKRVRQAVNEVVDLIRGKILKES